MSRFDQMTKAEKRVQIAKDVLLQLKKRRFKAESGTYFRTKKGAPLDQDVELQAVFKKVKHCDVCALGSMFVASVDRFDKLKVRDFVRPADYIISEPARWGSGREIRTHLLGFFSASQIDKIESAFEKSFMDETNGRHDTLENSVKFGERYSEDKARMIGIMENIIANKGTFIPSKGLRL